MTICKVSFYRVYVLTTLLMVSLSSSMANSSERKKAPNQYIEYIEEQMQINNCASCWSTLLEKANSGDIEARGVLFYLVSSSFSGMNSVYNPIADQDHVTRIRNVAILAVYAKDSEINIDKSVYEASEELSNLVFEAFSFENNNVGKKYFSCLRNEKRNCSKIAVDGNLIPSFEDFYREITGSNK